MVSTGSNKSVGRLDRRSEVRERPDSRPTGAESLPEEQLQLALEDAEQGAAAGQAESEQNNPAERKVRAARRRIYRRTCAHRSWSRSNRAIVANLWCRWRRAVA